MTAETSSAAAPAGSPAGAGADSGRPAVPRGRAALAGTVAAAVALGLSELAAGLVTALPSLVVAIGAAVIDAVPSPVKDAAIALLGTADKPVLVAGVVALALGAGALLGVTAARRFGVAAAGFAAFGVIGALAGGRDPRVMPALAALQAAVAVAVGLGTLRWLLAVGADTGPAGATRDEGPALDDGGPAPGDEGPAPGDEGARRAHQRSAALGIGPRGDRRAFLRATGAAAAAAAASGVAGRFLAARARAVAARADVVLPRPARRLPPPAPGAELAVDGLASLYTPNERFYRIDTALSVPRVDPARWRLRVSGMVDQPFELTYDELLALPQVEADVTLACVSNEVGGGLVGNARWLGVRLDALLERAGVQAGATQVVGRAVDGFTVGFPTQVALDGREALVAVGMNGEPLPIDHGFPARLVVPGLYGYVSATKWLAEIELTTWEAFDAYWVPRGWAKQAPVKTQSRIDVPRADAALSSGRQPIAGVAWAPHRGIEQVEVQVDDGPWRPARLGAEIGADAWRQWVLEWEAGPGPHVIRCRATDGLGRLQTERRSPPAPDGATGWHGIRVAVRDR